MTEMFKVRVLKRGRTQIVKIPDELRLNAEEVFVRRGVESRDLILSPVPRNWEEIYAALDAAGMPEDFLTRR